MSLNKSQLEYIDKYRGELSAKQIAKDCGTTATLVTQEITRLNKDKPIVPEVSEKDKIKPRKDTTFMKSIAKNKQSLVMTEGGAQMGDDFHVKKKGKKNKHIGCIHNPLGKEEC